MLKKVGRYVATRLQGSKGKRKYDSWMKRNPWASTALTVGDIALAGYAAPKAMAGLKGLLTGGKAAGAASAAAQPQLLGQLASADPMQSGQMVSRLMTDPAVAARPLGTGFDATRAAQNFLRETAGGAATAQPSPLANIGRTAMNGLRTAGRYVKDNPMPVAMALEGLLTGSQEAQRMRMERERFNQQRDQQQFLAQLLAPMFAQYYRGE